MRLLAITDLHGSLDALVRILAHARPFDAVLLGGDITHFGTPQDAEDVVRLARQSAPAVFAVAGNCDSAEIEGRLAQLGVSLHARAVEVGGLGLHGLSAIPPWISRMYQSTEDDLAAALEAGYRQLAQARLRAVLAHVPPRGLSVDRVFFGRHVGSTALRTFIEKRQPALVVCGHIHEARGVDQLGPTTVVNCGQAARGYYALVDADEAVSVTLGRA